MSPVPDFSKAESAAELATAREDEEVVVEEVKEPIVEAEVTDEAAKAATEAPKEEVKEEPKEEKKLVLTEAQLGKLIADRIKAGREDKVEKLAGDKLAEHMARIDALEAKNHAKDIALLVAKSTLKGETRDEFQQLLIDSNLKDEALEKFAEKIQKLAGSPEAVEATAAATAAAAAATQKQDLYKKVSTASGKGEVTLQDIKDSLAAQIRKGSD